MYICVYICMHLCMCVYVFVSVCTLTFVALLTLANRLDYCDIRAEMHFNNKSNLNPRG